MANEAYPSVNDTECSWADIKIAAQVDGGTLVDMADVAAVKDSRSVEVGKKRGASGGRVMSQTAGEGDQEASITFYRGGLRRLKKALMAKAPTRGNQVIIGRVPFDVTIQWTPLGEDEIYERIWKGCRFLGDAEDNGEGSDPDQVEVTLNPIEIADIIDGKEVVLI